MPTYLNRTGSIITPTRSNAITPNNPVELDYYISLHEEPHLEKISDLPEIAVQFEPIFTDVNTTTTLYKILTFSNRLLFQVKDGSTPCNDGDTVIITIFGGDTDNQSDWHDISEHTFTRKSYTDYDGNSIHTWGIYTYPNIEDGVARHPFRFWTVAITQISVSGNIVLSYRPFASIQY